MRSRGIREAFLAVTMGLGCLVGAASCVVYTPDSLLHRSRKWASARTVGCVDVATEIVRNKDVPDTSAVVDITFGNRCAHGVHLDLSRVQVFARYADGARLKLAAYDPRHEIEPKLLAPVGVGHEAIEFDPRFETTKPVRLCVSVLGIDADRANEDAPAMCFAAASGDDEGSMIAITETEL